MPARPPRSAAGIRLLLIAACLASVACKDRSASKASSDEPAARPEAEPPAPATPLRSRPSQVDFVIVAADVLAASAERYREFRDASGHNVALGRIGALAGNDAAPDHVADAIKAFIARHFAARDTARPFYVLLLGDASEPLPAATYVEASQGSEITSDNWYADMDGDQAPDLAIGRIPARDDEELDRIRGKIARYEETYRVGLFNRRIHLVAAPGGFGAFIDALIENLAYQLLDAFSYKYDISFTYASRTSPVFYVPETFSDRVFELLNAGSLFSVYVGHGSETALDDVVWNDLRFPLFDEAQLETALHLENKPPVLLLFTCLTGAFDDRESLAERLLRHEWGPPAVVASTEISHPYPNAVLLKELGWLIAKQRAPTVGELFRMSKLRLMESEGYCRELIDKYGRLVISDEEIAAQKRTHLHMYTLFGDPATRMAFVRGRAWISVEDDEVKRGARLPITASFSEVVSGGTAYFSLQSRREVILGKIDPLPDHGEVADRDRRIAANYATANNKVVAATEVSFEGRTASTTLLVPATLPPDLYFVKVYAHDADTDAFGHLAIRVVE